MLTGGTVSENREQCPTYGGLEDPKTKALRNDVHPP